MSLVESKSSNRSLPARPAALPGFESIRRYWDKKHETYAARILPGEYYVSVAAEQVITVLGSCVSACIRDKKLGIGGMNHFMLPEGEGGTSGERACITASTRYGTYAMENMINDILNNGGRRENLEVKVFGGGNVLGVNINVGARNIRFIREYLAREALDVVSEDLGGNYPRKVMYFPASGRVLLRKMPTAADRVVARRERAYQLWMATTPIAGELDLF
jgi:chemotaxis protein CheD